MVKGKQTAQNKALLLQHGRPTDNMETSLCLVIEFLSDLHNVLAVSLSYAHLSKLSLCLLECPHTGAHMVKHTAMLAYICTPTEQL